MDKIKNESIFSLEKIKVNGTTVKDLIDALKKIPENYEFMLAGEYGYALWIDNDYGFASIDEEAFIDYKIDEYSKPIDKIPKFANLKTSMCSKYHNYNDIKDFDAVELHLATKDGSKTIIGQFTPLRVNKASLPSTLCAYEIGGNDDHKDIPCRVARSVLVNYIGAIIIPKEDNITPIKLGKGGTLWLDESYVDEKFKVGNTLNFI